MEGGDSWDWTQMRFFFYLAYQHGVVGWLFFFFRFDVTFSSSSASAGTSLNTAS
jgi:hypothetical protein